MQSNTHPSKKLIIRVAFSLFCIVTILNTRADSTSYKGYTLYSPAANAEDYYVYTGFSMPDGDFTVCLWWRLISLSSLRQSLISIAVPAIDDLYYVGLSNHTDKGLSIRIESNGVYVGAAESLGNPNISDWIYTCTMSSYIGGGSVADVDIEVYHIFGEDSDWSLIHKYYKTGIDRLSVAGEAAVALYQDQDVVGGGFDADQASGGWRACLNIWSGTFSPDDLLNFADCKERGDIFSLSENVGVIGGDVAEQLGVDYCLKPQIHVVPVEQITRDKDSAQFCFIESKVLPGLTLLSTRVTSKLSCAMMCTVRDDCYSANFYPSTKTCELGGREESLQDELLITSTDDVHISFLFCRC